MKIGYKKLWVMLIQKDITKDSTTHRYRRFRWGNEQTQ